MTTRPKARKSTRGRSPATVRSGRRNGPRASARPTATPQPASGVNPRQTNRLHARSGRVATRPRAVPVPGKPIGKRDLQEFRRLLEEERERLADELEALAEHTPELEHQVGIDVGGSYDEDFADVAGETFEREKGLAIESSVQALLTQVEEGLARLDEGTYGICENCGRPIHPARLRAIPYAKLCIECKANEERANGVGRP